MRAAGLLAPTRVGRRRGPRNHDGTITTDRPDELWGTDATACLTTREGNAMVFIAVDHCTQECVGIHAARPGTRFEALEPLRQGLRAHHGGYGPGVAAGLSRRHDHGSQYLSDHFQGELRFLSRVGCSVMSVSQSRSGASATKRRRTRSSWTAGAGRACLPRRQPISDAMYLLMGRVSAHFVSRAVVGVSAAKLIGDRSSTVSQEHATV